MTDERKCPTCKHRHPNSLGLAMCGCEDCFLIWTDIPSQYLAPEKKIRQEELYQGITEAKE